MFFKNMLLVLPKHRPAISTERCFSCLIRTKDIKQNTVKEKKWPKHEIESWELPLYMATFVKNKNATQMILKFNK